MSSQNSNALLTSLSKLPGRLCRPQNLIFVLLLNHLLVEDVLSLRPDCHARVGLYLKFFHLEKLVATEGICNWPWWPSGLMRYLEFK